MNTEFFMVLLATTLATFFSHNLVKPPNPKPTPVAQKIFPSSSVMMSQTATTNCTINDTEYAMDSVEQQFISLFNNFRTQKGLTPVKISPNLTRAAAWQAYDMAQKNYFSHTDSTGRDGLTRIAQCGYTLQGKGENIAQGYSDAQSVLNAWIASPAHYRNMVDPTYIVSGIARSQNPTNGQWYWAHTFGGTDDSGTVPTITNAPPPVCTIGNNCRNNKFCCSNSEGKSAICDICDTGQATQTGCVQGYIAIQICSTGSSCQNAQCVTPPTSTPIPTAVPTTIPTSIPIPTSTPTSLPNITITPFLSPTSFITIVITPPNPTTTQIPTSQPTSLIPTSTLLQTQSFATVVLQAAGIGNLSGDNPNPKVTQRNATISVYQNDKKTLVTIVSDTITYDPQDGTYSNTITLPNLPSGNYFFSVKVDNSIPVFTSRFAKYLEEGQTIQFPVTKLILGDLNNDGLLNALDYTIFAKCYGNKICADKSTADLNSDGKVEDIDLNILLRNFSLQEQ